MVVLTPFHTSVTMAMQIVCYFILRTEDRERIYLWNYEETGIIVILRAIIIVNSYIMLYG